jgi:hypothetical protein
MRLLSRLRPGRSRGRFVLPPPGVLRRERRTLLKTREAELRDLGGLLVEMYRQNRFREDLVRERCERLLELDERALHVEGLLSALRRGLPPGRCECGALLVWNAHFCANCGRAAGEILVGCTSCGAPLPADANFCAACGAAVVPAATVEGTAALDAPDVVER